MLTLTTGNILNSKAEALVNTVNCEGFMGKGLAYQFKKQYPKTNDSYVYACKSKELTPNKLHSYIESGKLIVNFPTKNKWREKSKIEYIHGGMESLVNLIKNNNIKSIAIPPLGSGNGGLHWEEVKQIVLEYIDPLVNNVDIYIYEPASKHSKEIKLNATHLVLMSIKNELARFSKFRLEKTVFFINAYNDNVFSKFTLEHNGLHSNNIDKLSIEIKEFQKNNKLDTSGAFNYLKNIIVNKNIDKKLESLLPSIKKASGIINSYASNEKIELLSIICYIVSNSGSIDEADIINMLNNYSNIFKSKFSNKEISYEIEYLLSIGILQKNILNEYSIINNKIFKKSLTSNFT